jgi:hypothetical protein
MTMTYDTSQVYVVCLYVTRITIIDTIIHHILTNYTNDAYIYLVSMTYTPLSLSTCDPGDIFKTIRDAKALKVHYMHYIIRYTLYTIHYTLYTI